MKISKIILAAAAVLSVITTSSAAAGHRYPSQSGGSNVTIDVAAVPAYPVAGQAKSVRSRSRGQTAKRPAVGVPPSSWLPYAPEAGLPAQQPSLGQRTLSGYANDPGPTPTLEQAKRFGLVTIEVAGNHRITVSQDFAGPITGLIADLDAHGYRFTNIKCLALRGQGHHVRGSNHWGGNACDFFGQHPPADLVRAHGLRSGRDFADSMHVDNAKNVGGVNYWNEVKHRHYASHHHRTVRIAGR
jgi:hypothetical protein